MVTNPGALILGNEYQALGLLRQLRPHGIPCTLVDQDRWGPARLSRYRCRFHQSPRYADARFWPWLEQLAQDNGYAGWVIMPTDDEQVRQLAEHYEGCRTLFRYAGPSWNTFRLLYNKRLTYAWAQELGAPVPETFAPAHRHDTPGDDLPFPLIVKPAIKREYSRYSKKKAIRVDSPAQLERILSQDLQAVPVEDLLCQEIVPGSGASQWSYAGFFVEGQPVAAFTACRRRQHPPDFGRASTYVVARPEAEVEQWSRRLLAALGYTGLAEVEWKRDTRDGRLKLLEVNARCWGWHSLASRVVGNLPMMLYDYLVYQRVRPVEPHYGARWVKWITDVPVAASLLSRGELNLRDYMRSVGGNIVCCEWDQGDPFPFFLQFALVAYLALKRGY